MRGSGVRIPSAAPINYLIQLIYFKSSTLLLGTIVGIVATWSPRWSISRYATDARAFAEAAKIVSLKLVNQGVMTNYLDTRGIIAEYEAAHDRLTLTLSSQAPHAIRDVLAEVLHVSTQTLRVITPDVGGGRRWGRRADAGID
jgi:xanthine dehydrogenase molybdopterin-binding subunit B